jgi:hypothetical protein
MSRLPLGHVAVPGHSANHRHRSHDPSFQPKSAKMRRLPLAQVTVPGHPANHQHRSHDPFFQPKNVKMYRLLSEPEAAPGHSANHWCRQALAYPQENVKGLLPLTRRLPLLRKTPLLSPHVGAFREIGRKRLPTSPCRSPLASLLTSTYFDFALEHSQSLVLSRQC